MAYTPTNPKPFSEGIDVSKYQGTPNWGMLKDDNPDGHPWDPDLYGPKRWSMPAIDVGQNNNGDNE